MYTMRSITNNTKRQNPLRFVVALLFPLIFLFSGSVAHAGLSSPISLIELILASVQGDGPIDAFCNPTKAVYQRIMDDQPQTSILRTYYFMDSARPFKLWYNVTGMSIDNMIRCIPVIGDFCEVTDASSSCPISLTDLFSDSGRDRHYVYNKIMEDPTRENIFGLLFFFEYNRYEMKPAVNLAIHWNDTLGRMPFVGKALAFDGIEYDAPFSDAIRFGWMVTRMIAYSLLSLVMLYVGFAIILRKRVDQRTVVTVQYAVPKIAMAVILIAFSYPIGAVLTNLAWRLQADAPGIVRRLFEFTDMELPEQFWGWAIKIGIIVLLLILIVAFIASGVLLPVAIFLIIFLLGFLGLSLWIEVKTILIYIRMLIHIIFGPIDILYGALPGSDSAVGGWLVKMFAIGASLVAIGSARAFMDYLGLFIIFSNLEFNLANQDWGAFIFGAFTAFPVYFLFLMYGYILTLRIPKKVEEAIMEPYKKRKKRYIN